MILAAAVALHAPAAGAQRLDTLRAGVQVRVTPRFDADRPLKGRLLEADSLGLTVEQYRRAPMQLAYGDIVAVDVSRGRSRPPGGAALGAKRGFLLGATIGIVATSAAFVHDQRTTSEGFIPATVIIGAYSAGLTAATTAIGALVGNRARTRWERVWPGAASAGGTAAAGNAAVAGAGTPATIAPAVDATQLVVVTTAGWDSTGGQLRRFSRRSPDAPWRQEGEAAPVVVGRTGLAWGVGIERGGPRKAEGDGRAPAGIFPLTTAFGFAPADSASWLRMPYLPLSQNTECVDDVASAHYNTIVERDRVSVVDWTSSERMRRIPQYRLGLVAGYNTTPPVKGRGSCIFLHIWEAPGTPTVGCTAMDAGVLAGLMAWLDPRSRPEVVQLPAAEYAQLQGAWGLPALR